MDYSMNLINDILLRTGALLQKSKETPWFQGVSAGDIIVSIILPILITIAIAFNLKKRYLNKKFKDQITLNNFANANTMGSID